MRTLLIASAAIAAMTAGDASAQRVIEHGPGAPYAMPAAGQTMAPPPPPMRTTTTVGHPHGNRWGSKIDGHWWGGANAPGGWSAYRQPHRGWRVPGYWNSSRFYIADWADYGLPQPPYGYNWARYYDDAILIDDRGSVYDTVGGLDWDGYDGGYPGNEMVYSGNPGTGYAPQGAVQPTYGQSTYAPPPPPGDRGPGRCYGDDGRRSSGVGGAVAGAAVGGVAGNLIAGRGNRLGGTLIGAGAGGIAGYAIDRGTSGRYGPCRGAGYPQPPVAPGYPPPPPPPRADWVSPNGTTTVTTTTGGGYYGGGSTTTVVVQSAPIVTTTTTEIYEDAVTYSKPRRVWHKRVWHKPVWHKPACGCR